MSHCLWAIIYKLKIHAVVLSIYSEKLPFAPKTPRTDEFEHFEGIAAEDRLAEEHGFFATTSFAPATSWCLGSDCGSSMREHGACYPGNSSNSSFVPSLVRGVSERHLPSAVNIDSLNKKWVLRENTQFPVAWSSVSLHPGSNCNAWVGLATWCTAIDADIHLILLLSTATYNETNSRISFSSLITNITGNQQQKGQESEVRAPQQYACDPRNREVWWN